MKRMSAKRAARDRNYDEQRMLAHTRDRGMCIVCMKPGESTHHRQGRGIPDPHRLSNLITVCGDGTRGCHGRIHRNPAWAYDNGYMVHRNGVETPENTPVRYGDMFVDLTNGDPS